MRRLDLPPVWGAGFAVAIWLWSGWASLAPLPGWTLHLGRALMVAGCLWAAWAVLHFLRAGTPIEPGHVPRALVTGGPYRLVRNPMYRGLVWVLTGWALMLGEATAIPFALAYGLLLGRRFAAVEEQVLRETFGQAFDDWAAQVRLRL